MRRLNQGFTVIELLIAITVVGIILALAMPSYQDIINKRAVTNAAEQVATARVPRGAGCRTRGEHR